MNQIKLVTLLIASALMFSACGLRSNASPTTIAVATGTASEPSSTDTPSPVTLAPSPDPTAVLSRTASPAAVTLSAVKGNLFIRRGPDLAFNPVSVLMQGQSEPALARDVLSTWVQIPIPGASQKTGWVSVQTVYSHLTGDIMTLPEITPTDWPDLAFLRNCTYDDMVTDPGGIVIPSLDNFPANEVQVDPGSYRIHDTAVDGSPEVLKVELREGLVIDIHVDGNGEKRKCPQP